MTPKKLRKPVVARACDRCEYCRLPQGAVAFAPFHVEHIVARQHGGKSVLANLALSCDRCNAYKGPNLTAIDPKTMSLVPLFNPRRQSWDEHFVMAGAEIRGLTPTGRATVHLLNMNAARRIALRRLFR
jgi:5-methylcytosine-specific restriction endonuclease McrA